MQTEFIKGHVFCSNRHSRAILRGNSQVSWQSFNDIFSLINWFSLFIFFISICFIFRCHTSLDIVEGSVESRRLGQWFLGISLSKIAREVHLIIRSILYNILNMHFGGGVTKLSLLYRGYGELKHPIVEPKHSSDDLFTVWSVEFDSRFAVQVLG